MKYPFYISGVIALFLFVGVSTGQGGDSRHSPWELAAQNWEAAARARSDHALHLLSQADEQRESQPVGNDKMRRMHFDRIGKIEISAGGLFSGARNNFGKAAADWEQAVKFYKKTDTEALLREASLNRDDAKSSARHACHLAAQSYERAAQAYSLGKGDNLILSASASEKAALCREIIAKMPKS